ncbi:MarR family transcriptional regulator [Natronomonas sp. F2-12]|jgi:predicted transcriptional regulator|uniref:MarR family transcriptional regulator n=1 Tax=Natronomonas aquatica TaxID=2841590 RepID=A0A9R1CNN7_9EURY|nr:MarR family transcriptional regulator [Natronomonas aquatica]MCQ4332149.1 MarR family transcriptional regulator [Natronomonas aquatica]
MPERGPDGGIDEGKRATLRRFAALGAATPLVRLSGNDTSDVRDAIVGYLAATPGAHFSKLRDDLQLGTGETQHHLRRLEGDGAVEHRKDGEYKRYFPADRFSDFEQRALGYLRRETPRRMLIALLRDPAVPGSDIAATADVSRSTVSKYAAELEAAGLVSRDDGYELRRPETLLTLVVRYADSFGETAVAFAGEADAFVRYDP